MSFNGDLNAGDAGEDLTTKGDLHGFDTENTRIPVGADGTVLTADSTAALGLAYSTSAANVLTTQGDVLYHNASGLARLGAGISGQQLQTQGAGANPIWVSAAGGSVATDELVNDYSTTLSEYDQAITTATASTDSSSAYNFTQTATGCTNQIEGSYGYSAYSYKVETDFGGVGAEIDSIKVRLKKQNTWNESGSYVGISTSTCGAVDVSYGAITGAMLTYSFQTLTFSAGTHTLAAGNYIVVKANANNYYEVHVDGSTGSAPTGLTAYRDNGGCGTGGCPIYLELDGTAYHTATNALSGSTATFWQSTAAANNWLQLDLGSNQDVTAMTIYLDTTATTETQFLLQSSTDAISWTDLRTINVSALTDAAYNYIRFNPQNARYFRIYGNSGSSTIMKINEVALQPLTMNLHGHLGIDATDATLALNGE